MHIQPPGPVRHISPSANLTEAFVRAPEWRWHILQQQVCGEPGRPKASKCICRPGRLPVHAPGLPAAIGLLSHPRCPRKFRPQTGPLERYQDRKAGAHWRRPRSSGQPADLGWYFHGFLFSGRRKTLVEGLALLRHLTQHLTRAETLAILVGKAVRLGDKGRDPPD